jgi:Zn-finger nucleic acid-binding protein
MQNHGVKLDVCMEGCGGIWFDWQELRKTDEVHEADAQFIEKLGQSKTTKIDLKKQLNCPMCEGVVMVRRFWSTKRQVEMDECGKCGGMWLDAGELTHIHSLFKTEAERRAEADRVYSEMFGSQMTKISQESNDKYQAAQKVAKALRFICPSYFLPGKQDWGAF